MNRQHIVHVSNRKITFKTGFLDYFRQCKIHVHAELAEAGSALDPLGEGLTAPAGLQVE